MKIIDKNCAGFPEDKAFSDFEGDAENHRFYERHSMPGKHLFNCFVRGVTNTLNMPAFDIEFNGSGRLLDEQHSSYTAQLQWRTCHYDAATLPLVNDAMRDAQVFMGVMLADNCAALQARDAAYLAQRKLERDIAKAQREARIASTEPVGEKKAKAIIAAQIKALKQARDSIAVIEIADRIDGDETKYSLYLSSTGRLNIIRGGGGGYLSQKLLTHNIAVSDAAKVRTALLDSTLEAQQ